MSAPRTHTYKHTETQLDTQNTNCAVKQRDKTSAGKDAIVLFLSRQRRASYFTAVAEKYAINIRHYLSPFEREVAKRMESAAFKFNKHSWHSCLLT